MPKILFATDLDRTMIYSAKFLEDAVMDDIQCIEHNEKGEIAYMLKESIALKEELSQLLYLVPVTTRSRALFERVTVFRDSEYAVIENGAIILHHGEILEFWEREIENYLLKGDFVRKLKGASDLLSKIRYTAEDSVRWIGNKFVMCKTDYPEKMGQLLSELLDIDDFHYTIQGRKVYVIPKGITKENAVSFLKGLLKINHTFASGDGKLDLEMLLQADTAFVPSDAELLKDNGNTDHPGLTVSKYCSFHATLDILKNVKEQTLLLLAE